MRHKLRSGVIALTVLLFMSSFCYADSLAFLDWDKVGLFMEDNAVIGTWETECSASVTGTGQKHDGLTPYGSASDYREFHKYLGYSAVILAGLAAVTSSSKSVHYGAAYGSALAAAGTLTTGFMEYGDRYNHEDGLFARDNAHILLGTIGAVACIAAVVMADSGGGGGHAGAGIVGGSAMALSVVTIKW